MTKAENQNAVQHIGTKLMKFIQTGEARRVGGERGSCQGEVNRAITGPPTSGHWRKACPVTINTQGMRKETEKERESRKDPLSMICNKPRGATKRDQ